MKPLRPFVYQAYYQWIVENGWRAYLLVDASYPEVDVPQEFVKDGQILLNISPHSIGNYEVDDTAVSFNARFGGMLRDLYLPFGAMIALFAQENQRGIFFDSEACYQRENLKQSKEESPTSKKGERKKPSFTIV